MVHLCGLCPNPRAGSGMGELGPLAAGMGEFGQRSCLWETTPWPYSKPGPNPQSYGCRNRAKEKKNKLIPFFWEISFWL